MAGPIKTLFISNGRPGAAQWFDRTFAAPSAPLEASWVSIDPEGRVIAHVAALPLRLLHGADELTGAVLCNLISDQERSTFFPILAVVKRAVSDLRAEGAEFILTNPSNAGAVAVMKTAGLRQVATHSRYLCPLGDERRPLDALIGIYLRVHRLLASRLLADPVSPLVAAEWTVEHSATGATVTARRTPRQYAMRFDGFGGGDDLGFILRDSRGEEVGAALVRLDRSDASAGLLTLRCTRSEHVQAAVSALSLALRARGARRLNALAIVGSRFARGLVRGGFVPRPETCVIVGIGFTDAARAAVEAVRDSDIERVDLD